MKRDPDSADRAVSHAYDHFQQRYFELHKATSGLLAVWDAMPLDWVSAAPDELAHRIRGLRKLFKEIKDVK